MRYGLSRPILLLSVCLVFIAQVQISWCQAIRSEEQAIARTKEFLSSIGAELDSSDLICDLKSAPGVKETCWKVEPRLHGWFIMINGSDGKIIGFYDRQVDAQIYSRKPGTKERLIRSDSEAWTVAQNFVNASGIASGFSRGEIRNFADAPNADFDTNNTGYRYEVVFDKTVEGYPGRIDFMVVSLDVVTGKIISFRGPSGTEYLPPKSILSKSDAVKKLRDLCNSESEKYQREGQAEWAAQFQWPGDEVVSQSLALGVTVCSGCPLESAFGDLMRIQNKARLTWSGPINEMTIAIDAENAEPLFLARAKSIPKSAKPPMKSRGSIKSQVQSPYPPPHPGLPWFVKATIGMVIGLGLVMTLIVRILLGRAKARKIQNSVTKESD